MAKWMVSKGARHIVLLSRSGELRGNAKEQIDSLNRAGAMIVVRSCDVADRTSVDKLVSVDLTGLPPVRGIVHGAMVLHVRSSDAVESTRATTDCIAGRLVREDDASPIHICYRFKSTGRAKLPRSIIGS
jgi:hypothetical protein